MTKITREDKAKITSFHIMRYSNRKIAKILEVSPSIVDRYIQQTKRKRGRPKKNWMK